MVEAGQDYEERVAFLLKQLTNKTLANTSNPGGASGTGNDLVDNGVKDADIQKFSMIQKALQVWVPAKTKIFFIYRKKCRCKKIKI